MTAMKHSVTWEAVIRSWKQGTNSFSCRRMGFGLKQVNTKKLFQLSQIWADTKQNVLVISLQMQEQVWQKEKPVHRLPYRNVIKIAEHLTRHISNHDRLYFINICPHVHTSYVQFSVAINRTAGRLKPLPRKKITFYSEINRYRKTFRFNVKLFENSKFQSCVQRSISKASKKL